MFKFLKNFNKRLGQKGNIALAYLFIVSTISLLFFFAIAIPFVMDVNAKFYSASAFLLADTNSTIQSITDPGMKAQISAAITSGPTAIANNTSILDFFFQYSWAFIIIILLLGYFMLSRRTVETDLA